MNDKYWIEEDMSTQEHSGHWHEHPDGGSHEHGAGPPPPPWKHDGVRVIPGNRLDANTAQTPGMDRKAAINFARVGAQKLWAGTVTIHAKRQNRGAPSRPSGERNLHRQGPCTHALGRPSGVHGGGRDGRLHLRAPLRSAPGNQRQPDRGAGVRAVPQRWRGGRGEPGHRACRKAGAGAVGQSHASQGRRLGNRTSRAINPYVIGITVFG